MTHDPRSSKVRLPRLVSQLDSWSKRLQYTAFRSRIEFIVDLAYNSCKPSLVVRHHSLRVKIKCSTDTVSQSCGAKKDLRPLKDPSVQRIGIVTSEKKTCGGRLEYAHLSVASRGFLAVSPLGRRGLGLAVCCSPSREIRPRHVGVAAARGGWQVRHPVPDRR